jgi:hypothetical protein
MERDAIAVVFAYERVRAKQKGKKTYLANRTWIELGKLGIQQAVARRVISPYGASGFDALAAEGMHALTFEAVVLRHPDEFEEKVVSRAKQRLAGSGGVIALLPVQPEEVAEATKYVEGATRAITVNAYERNPAARAACVAHYGPKCAVCGFDFLERYGAIGEGFIHVHHVKPLSEVGCEYVVDPIKDLRPVCPNCHAMLHRRDPPLQIDELQCSLVRAYAVRER